MTAGHPSRRTRSASGQLPSDQRLSAAAEADCGGPRRTGVW
ncbi:hypothetical protein SFR_4094 [Streptomyces sp. FR-008]|nr:hypothetical protein SFR_4094 [Streptomyces sp. FR-008]